MDFGSLSTRGSLVLGMVGFAGGVHRCKSSWWSGALELVPDGGPCKLHQPGNHVTRQKDHNPGTELHA